VYFSRPEYNNQSGSSLQGAADDDVAARELDFSWVHAVF
jgi:hypothetical protein